MDHLHTPETKAQGVLLCEPVAWLGFEGHNTTTAATSAEYVPLYEYPKSRGWDLGTYFIDGDITSIKNSNGEQTKETELFAFLQSLLYFGFLEGVLHTRINIHDFIRTTNEGSKVLNTAKLIDLLGDLYTRAHKLPYASGEEWVKSISEDFRQLSQWWRFLRKNNKINIPSYFMPILRSIKTLQETIIPVAGMLFRNDYNWKGIFESMPMYWQRLPFNGEEYNSLVRELLGKGYCPFQIENAGPRRNMVSLLEYMNANSVKLVRTDGRDHGGCSKKECVNYQVTAEQMKKLRATCPCGRKCEQIRPSLEDVLEILQNDKIPCIVYDKEASNAGSKLKIVPVDNDDQYAAISHCWADGLGSTTEAGLYECELMRLQGAAEEAISQALHSEDTKPTLPVKFWIDSLCIPEDIRARKKAIRLMSKTYTNATVVVVLDKIIRGASKTSPQLELYIRIVLSGWNYRLWTLQEGILAKKIAFELADGINLYHPPFQDRGRDRGGEKGWVKDAALAKWILESHLELNTLLMTWFLNQNPLKSQVELTIQNMVPMVCRRRTSKPRDEVFALAPLLGLDVKPFQESKRENLLIDLLIAVREVPGRLPFIRSPKATDVEGFTWAPVSLMSLVDDDLTGLDSRSSYVTKNGLFGRYTLIVPKPLYKWQGKLDETYYFESKRSEGPGMRQIKVKHDYDGTSTVDTSITYNAILLEKSGKGITYGLAVQTDGSIWKDEKGELTEDDYFDLFDLDDDDDKKNWTTCVAVSTVFVIDDNLKPLEIERGFVKASRYDGIPVRLL